LALFPAFGNSASNNTCYAVPANMRLVIEQASVQSSFGPPRNTTAVEFKTTTGGQVIHVQVPVALAGSFGSAGSQLVRSYADAGTAVQVGALREGDSNGAAENVVFDFAGYLVSVP
jgi:hypothetical protein